MFASRRFVLLLLLCVQSVYSMEMPVSKIKCEKAFNALLQNVWFCFRHDDFRNLAMVNKSIRQSVLDSAEQRKYKFREDINKQARYNTVLFANKWNKYGSACCIGGTKQWGATVLLCCHKLAGNKCVSSKMAEWPEFLHGFSTDTLFVVTETGDIRFYGCGKEGNRQNFSQHIFEYSLLSDGTKTRKKCFVVWSDKNVYEMMIFIEDLFFLQRLLKSNNVTEKDQIRKTKTSFSKTTVKLFDLAGADLSDEYKRQWDMKMNEVKF